MDILTSFLTSIKPQKDGDTIDRINYFYTTVILTVFAVFISGWSFVGKPIECWFPAYYKGWWVEYALDYCYVQNTYFLPLTEHPAHNYWEIADQLVHIPKNITERENLQLPYYQWVPFILALEALLFYIPVVAWRNLYEASGIKVQAICDFATQSDNMKPATRQKNIRIIANYMDHTLAVSDGLNEGWTKPFVGSYITVLFLVVKFLFAFNCIAQFFMLQYMLGLTNFWWGSDVISDLIAGREWSETGNFPRVTMCDFQVRVLGNLHRHTVQCVLMINMFNEKIFVFLWWWFLVIGVLTTFSFLYWLATSLIDATSVRVVTNYLRRIDPGQVDNPRRKKLINLFVKDTLRQDGVFLLRLIAGNAGDLVANDLLEAMWDKFQLKHNRNTPPPPAVQSQPSAPPQSSTDDTPVKLAGKTPSEYPTMPLGGYSFPPRYADQDLDQPDIHQRKPTNQQQSTDL